MTFTAAVTQMLQLVLQKIRTCNGPPDPEAVLPADQAPKHHNLDWAKIIVVFSLASAIDIAIVSVQIPSQKLPLIFYFLELAILLAFSCFFISKSVHSNCPPVAEVLEKFGIFFGVTAFFISITVPFSAVWFKCITCFVYAVSWLAILFCNSLS